MAKNKKNISDALQNNAEDVSWEDVGDRSEHEKKQTSSSNQETQSENEKEWRKASVGKGSGFEKRGQAFQEEETLSDKAKRIFQRQPQKQKKKRNFFSGLFGVVRRIPPILLIGGGVWFLWNFFVDTETEWDRHKDRLKELKKTEEKRERDKEQVDGMYKEDRERAIQERKERELNKDSSEERINILDELKVKEKENPADLDTMIIGQYMTNKNEVEAIASLTQPSQENVIAVDADNGLEAVQVGQMAVIKPTLS